MAVLIAVVVVLAAALLVNLTLTFGVIRRLREHEERLARAPVPALGAPQAAMLTPGSVVHDFVALTAEDEPVTRDALSGPALVAFVSTHCSSCRDALPEIVTAAAAMPRDQVLAVVVGEIQGGDDDVYEEFRGVLEPVARVARDIDGGQLPTVFGVQGFPAIGVIGNGGIVLSCGYSVADVALPAGVAGGVG